MKSIPRGRNRPPRGRKGSNFRPSLQRLESGADPWAGDSTAPGLGAVSKMEGRAVYEFYFANLNKLDTPKFKISTWDAGWWQIRNALADQNLGDDLLAAVKTAHDALKAKLLPQLPEYGFIAAEHEAAK